MNAPTVMISSTCYDLRQIRADLSDFLSNALGYVPLLSELDSFPVDPDVDTIENCRRRVEREADVLVLVIGGRYGSVDSRTSKSITNIEYLAARTKGIPVYAFVEKSVLAVLSVWKKNPDADFSSAVDNPNVFQFIEEVRSAHKVWTFEFEKAHDITNALRKQFAHLFRDGLHYAMRIRDVENGKTLASLHGRALRVALERPMGWEYLLFAQILIDEVSVLQDFRREHELGLRLGVSENVPILDLTSWTTPRIAELESLSATLLTLMNNALPEAFGKPGEPGNIREIVFVARRIVQAYRRAIEWSQHVRQASGDDRLRPVLDAMAKFPNDIIRKIEGLGPHIKTELEKALQEPKTGGPVVVDITLTLDICGADEFAVAMHQLQESLGESGYGRT